MADEQMKIAYLKVGEERVEAFVADLSKWPLSFTAPYKITTKTASPYSSRRLGLAYDENKREILAAYHGAEFEHTVKPESSPEFKVKLSTVNLWSIGPYFSLNSVETTPTRSTAGHDVGVTVQGDLVTVCAPSTSFSDYASVNRPAMAQRKSNTPWQSFDFKPAEERVDYGNSQLCAGDDNSSMDYILHFRTAAPYREQVLFVDQMERGKFANFNVDKSNQRWKSFRVAPEDGDTWRYLASSTKPLITTDEETGKHRAILFYPDASEQCIRVMYIPLRKDGSVDSSGDNVEAEFGGNIGQVKWTTYFRDFSVTALPDKLVLLMWHRDKDYYNEREGLQGLLLDIDSDGTLSRRSDVMDFNLPKPAAGSYDPDPFKEPGAWSAVVVPASFVV